MTKTNSWKTAIKRTRPSAPMAHLHKLLLIRGRALDYGCGKGFDADHFGMDKYDPYFYPVIPGVDYDTITCNFVLNVLENEEDRLTVLKDIQGKLKISGFAYISVRTDKKALKGATKIGTWQGLIKLDLPIVQRGSSFITYRMTVCDLMTSAPAETT